MRFSFAFSRGGKCYGEFGQQTSLVSGLPAMWPPTTEFHPLGRALVMQPLKLSTAEAQDDPGANPQIVLAVLETVGDFGHEVLGLYRSGIEYILRKHVRTAVQHCPSLVTKRVCPARPRHTCALAVLQATKDLRKVSLWLGHAHMQTTEIYTRADPSVKLEALESVMPPKLRSGRFKASDKLIESLKSLSVMQGKNRLK